MSRVDVDRALGVSQINSPRNKNESRLCIMDPVDCRYNTNTSRTRHSDWCSESPPYRLVSMTQLFHTSFERKNLNNNPTYPGYLNQQPIEKVIDQGDVEKDNFVLYFPSDPKVLDRLEEAANNHPTGYGDEPPENELPNQPLQEQEETKDSQPSEVNQWEGSHEQEVNPIESKSRFQDLIRRINLSNSGLPLEKMQLYELSDPVKMRKSATTTARPIYDQIPRPLLYNNGREADSFR